MKNLLYTFLFLVVAGAVLVSSKPSDQDCIHQVRDAASGGTFTDQLTGLITTNRYTVLVEDHVFYKTISSAIDGHKLGTGIFGTVILSQ